MRIEDQVKKSKQGCCQYCCKCDGRCEAVIESGHKCDSIYRNEVCPICSNSEALITFVRNLRYMNGTKPKYAFSSKEILESFYKMVELAFKKKVNKKLGQ